MKADSRGVSSAGRGVLIWWGGPLKRHYIPEFLPEGRETWATYPLALSLCWLRGTFQALTNLPSWAMPLHRSL